MVNFNVMVSTLLTHYCMLDSLLRMINHYVLFQEAKTFV